MITSSDFSWDIVSSRTRTTFRKSLQGKLICAAEGHRLAIQTVKVLKSIRSDKAFDAFYATVLVKKRSLLDIGDPTLTRQRQQPNNLDDYFGYGSSRSHQPTTAADHYRKQYFEAADLLVNTTEDRFYHKSYKTYGKLECLLIDSLCSHVQERELEEIGQIYKDDIDNGAPSLSNRTVPADDEWERPDMFSGHS